MRSHPAEGVEWGCPECESTNIAGMTAMRKARHNRPDYGCLDCGIKFDSPNEIEVAQ